LVDLNIDFAGSESTRESELTGDTFDTVGRVEVLDQADLITSCSSLTGDDGGVSKEEFPDLEVN